MFLLLEKIRTGTYSGTFKMCKLLVYISNLELEDKKENYLWHRHIVCKTESPGGNCAISDNVNTFLLHAGLLHTVKLRAVT